MNPLFWKWRSFSSKGLYCVAMLFDQLLADLTWSNVSHIFLYTPTGLFVLRTRFWKAGESPAQTHSLQFLSITISTVNLRYKRLCRFIRTECLSVKQLVASRPNSSFIQIASRKQENVYSMQSVSQSFANFRKGHEMTRLTQQKFKTGKLLSSCNWKACQKETSSFEPLVLSQVYYRCNLKLRVFIMACGNVSCKWLCKHNK